MKMNMRHTILIAFICFFLPASSVFSDALSTTLMGVSGDAVSMGVSLAACFIPQWSPYTNKNITSVISIDMAFLDEALENGGLGWGVSAETAANDYLSVKVRAGLFDRDFGADYKVDIILSDIYLCYNFYQKGLSGPNLDLGFGYGQSITTTTTENHPVTDTSVWKAQNEYFIPYISANLGYKFNFGYLMIEPYYNILHPMVNTHLSETGIHWAYVDMIGMNVGLEY